MTLGIIQARMGSTRFPGKVMAKICGIPLLILVIQRCQRSKLVDEWVVATTLERRDDVLCELGMPFFRGPTENVLARFYFCARSRNLEPNDIIVRVTADDPLRDPSRIDNCIDCIRITKSEYWESFSSYCSTPIGVGSEAFTMRALFDSYHWATTDDDKEHVTLWMQRYLKKNALIYAASSLSLTIDYPEDLKRIEKMIGDRDPVTIDYRELIGETAR